MQIGAGEVFGSRPGQLKVFIGAAPGVGKTYTMLREAASLKERGTDIVIGYVDVHNRPDTATQMAGLEILPRKTIQFRNHIFEEVDLNAIVSRKPDVVVIDELAHSNAPGSLFPKRYMDVEYLLDQGISVLTAVNVQHIEGIHEEAEQITGMPVRELIPETFVKRADEVSVIDVTPETLRQRLRDGSIYPADKVEQALDNFFRKSNLSGLRELALRTVADDVDARLERSISRSKIPGPVGAKEVIMVCVSHFPRAVKLVERGHRMAVRMKADLIVLTIANTGFGQLAEREKSILRRLQDLALDHDAQWVVELRNERKTGVVIADVAKRLNVTQIVIGQPEPDKQWSKLRDNPVRYLIRTVRYADLRIVGWKDNIDVSSRSIRTSYAQRQNVHASQGRLTIYVGSAPGVGKTYRMLQDAHDWKRRGLDVVIGLIETHGRAETAEQIGDLEVVPKRSLLVDGRTYEEMDVDAIVMRRPQIVLVDELAHSNIPGCARDKRYQDVEYLLNQGINVVTAVNVQHLESLHDKVEHITGVKVRERIPDWFVKMAREVKLIDATPETLQQRLIEGRIYALEKVQQALDNFFQTTNLAALREIALLEVADDVDQRIRTAEENRHGIYIELERILVCVNHRPHSEKLIRRGWRIADRLKAELWVLVVLEGLGMTPQDERDLARIQHLSEQFGAHFLASPSKDDSVGQAIVRTAEDLQVTQIVTGQPLIEKGFLARFKSTPLDYVLQHAEFVDLHMVATERDS